MLMHLFFGIVNQKLQLSTYQEGVEWQNHRTHVRMTIV